MALDVDRSEFGQFVAAVWERQGWEAHLTRDEGRTFVAVQRPATGEEGLVWAVAGGEVGGQQVQQFRSLCDEYEVDEGAIVTGGTVSEHAEKVADGTGVELLDGEGLETVVEREGLGDLAAQYAAGDGGGGGSAGGGASDGESPLAPARAVAERAADLASGVPVVAVVVVLAVVGGGVLLGPSVPFLGGGGDAISAESTAPEGANASLHVTWNAKVTGSIDPNASDGMAYPAPEGEQFVLVRMKINNTGNVSVPLRQSAFRLRANGTTHANATLADHDVFLGLPVDPGERLPVWTVFTIPDDESGTLVYDRNATDVSVAVTFERDRDLAVNETRI